MPGRFIRHEQMKGTGSAAHRAAEPKKEGHDMVVSFFLVREAGVEFDGSYIL